MIRDLLHVGSRWFDTNQFVYIDQDDFNSVENKLTASLSLAQPLSTLSTLDLQPTKSPLLPFEFPSYLRTLFLLSNPPSNNLQFDPLELTVDPLFEIPPICHPICRP